MGVGTEVTDDSAWSNSDNKQFLLAPASRSRPFDGSWVGQIEVAVVLKRR